MSRLLARALVAAVFVLPACGTDAPPDDEPVETVAHPLDDAPCKGVPELLAAHHAAFSSHDAAAFGATFTDTARHTGPHSVTNVGAAQLTQVHTFLFSSNGPFTNAISTASTRNITCLRGGIATVDQLVDLTGYKSLSPGNVPTFPATETTPDIFRTVQRFVLVKQDGTWLIQTLQLTPVLPAFANVPFPP